MLSRQDIIRGMFVLGLSLPMFGFASELKSIVALNSAIVKPVEAFKQPLIPAGFTYHRNLIVGEVAGVTLTLDIAEPPKINKKLRPALVSIYGGAWRRGSKDSSANRIVSFAKRDYVGVSIEYRLSPQYIFPAQVEDVKAAIRFLKANAETYGIDPERIIVFGTSAGGHLAAMLAVTGQNDTFNKNGMWVEQNSSVFAAVEFSGPTAGFLSAHSDSWESLMLFLGGKPSDIPMQAKAAMPITYVDKDDSPLFIAHGDADKVVPVEVSREFVAALKNAGTQYEYLELESSSHRLLNRYPDAQLKALNFIERLLKKSDEVKTEESKIQI